MASKNGTAFQASANNPVNIGGKRKRASWRAANETAPTWDGVPAALISGIVRMCTTQGASPTFGYTRNGSALILRVWHKGDSDVQYLTGADEVREYAVFLATEWFDIGVDDLDYYALGEAEKA